MAIVPFVFCPISHVNLFCAFNLMFLPTGVTSLTKNRTQVRTVASCLRHNKNTCLFFTCDNIVSSLVTPRLPYLSNSSSVEDWSFTTGEFLMQRMRQANFKVARLCIRRSGRGQTHATMTVRQLPPKESLQRSDGVCVGSRVGQVDVSTRG